MRISPDNDASPPAHPRWVQWLSDRPAGFYLFVSVAVAALIIAFVLWLEERTLALVASLCFLGILVAWTRVVWREWTDADTAERVIGVIFFFVLVGATASNVVRYLLLT